MNDSMLQNLLDLACSVGWGASEILRRYYRSQDSLDVQDKGGDPVTAADVAANHYILKRLQAELPEQEFGYLSEETYQPGLTPYKQPYLWIIDPLDGTRDFVKHTGDYAVHIALVHQGRPILAVVACPEAETLYYATRGGGTFVKTPQGVVSPRRVGQSHSLEHTRFVVSRSHRDQRLQQLLTQLPQQEQRMVGSVGCKVAAILEQQADAYVSLPTTSAPKDWDLAAPELILTEAGGQFTHFDLSPLQYNQEDVSQWGGFLASAGPCQPQLCRRIQDILATLD